MTLHLLALFLFLGNTALAPAEEMTGTGNLPPPDSPLAMGWLLGGLVALAVAGNQILGGVINLRKLRGIDTAVDNRYATGSKVSDIERDVASLRGELTAVQTTLSNELRAIHRSLGRIEGRLGTDSN